MSQRRIITRRQMLHGLGGFTLGLPFLPSLLPRTASAQEAVFQAGPRFFAMATNHGGLYESAMYPPEADQSETHNLYSGHVIRRGELVRRVSGGNASVSSILSAPESELTETLVQKMNVLRGLDIPFYIAHHTGGHLGNYARNDGNGAEGQSIQGQPMPTIDQVMAWSNNFYGDLAGVTRRSLNAGFGLSWGFSNPQQRSGSIQAQPSVGRAAELFDQVFPNPIRSNDDSDEEAPRTPVVDRVLEAYNRLRQSNRRMSREDRQRLDDHMARLSELERRLTVVPRESAICESPARPGSFADEYERYEQMIDVIAAAFICGSSRIATVGVTESGLTFYDGDWHQDVAHQWSTDAAQARLQEVNQGAFREVLLGLAQRLDVEEAPGQTVLDNSLLVWSQESGEVTHDSRSIPVITFGSAGGRLRTGQTLDFRNLSEQGMRIDYGAEAGHTGLLYSQWLASCMRAMGLSPSDWRDTPNIGSAGYSVGLIDDSYGAAYSSGVTENADEMLPLLEA